MVSCIGWISLTQDRDWLRILVNVVMSLGIMKCLAEDRNRWRALVNWVLNFRFHEMLVNSLVA
jgi:hypothetical protein